MSDLIERANNWADSLDTYGYGEAAKIMGELLIRLAALEEFAAAVRGGTATQFQNVEAFNRYLAAFARVWPDEKWGGIKDGDGGTYVEHWMPNTPDRRYEGRDGC